MKSFLFVIFTLVLSNTWSQKHLHLKFPPKVGGQDLILNTNVNDLNGVTFKVENFMWYLSNVHIYHDGGQDLDLSDTVILVRAESPTLYLGQFDVTVIDSIDFGVGVPQELNHLDISLYPENHPLSWQTPAMHWGWSAGYKFLLVDARGDGNGDGNPESVFQLHDLGDANYKYVAMPVIPTNDANAIYVVINCNLDEWIYGAHPGTTGAVHGSTGINAQTMGNVNNRTVFEVAGDAGLSSVVEEGELNYKIMGDDLVFYWNDVAGAHACKLVSTNGEVIATTEAKGNGLLQVSDLRNGIYFFYVLSADGAVLNTIKALK